MWLIRFNDKFILTYYLLTYLLTCLLTYWLLWLILYQHKLAINTLIALSVCACVCDFARARTLDGSIATS